MDINIKRKNIVWTILIFILFWLIVFLGSGAKLENISFITIFVFIFWGVGFLFDFLWKHLYYKPLIKKSFESEENIFNCYIIKNPSNFLINLFRPSINAYIKLEKKGIKIVPHYYSVPIRGSSFLYLLFRHKFPRFIAFEEIGDYSLITKTLTKFLFITLKDGRKFSIYSSELEKLYKSLTSYLI